MFNPGKIRTLVIKIGTQLLTGRKAFEGHVMEEVVKEIASLKRKHALNVLIVSSGAVGCGMNALGLKTRPADLPGKQAVAAVGQAQLMHYYETLLTTHGDGLKSAQVLLSWADLDNRRSYLNVRNTFNMLFAMKSVVPIVNENDSTAVEELRFGDNDTLSAKIAAKINAGLLIILSDIDGLYDRNPAKYPNAKLIPRVDSLTDEIWAGAGGAGSMVSTGGMRTKLEAARIACAAGVPVAIANGHREGVIQGVLAGTTPCTVFAAAHDALPHRKRWIAFGRAVQGRVRIDDGARTALLDKGKSLLAAGITDVSGEFDVGAAVAIADSSGRDIARGLVNYSSRDLERIRGRKSREIEAVLGHKDFDEVIHRDNLALL